MMRKDGKLTSPPHDADIESDIPTCGAMRTTEEHTIVKMNSLKHSESRNIKRKVSILRYGDVEATVEPEQEEIREHEVFISFLDMVALLVSDVSAQKQ